MGQERLWPQVKTTEPMVSNKVTHCSIHLGSILTRDCFAKNYMGSFILIKTNNHCVPAEKRKPYPQNMPSPIAHMNVTLCSTPFNRLK